LGDYHTTRLQEKISGISLIILYGLRITNMATGKSKARSRPARRNRRKARVSKPLKTAINRLISGQMETKYRAESLRVPGGSTLTAFTGFSSAITGTGEIYSLLPTLSEGAGSFQRNGVVVFPKKLRVHLNIVSTQNNLKNADYMVYAFFLQSVSVKALANYTAIPITQLMEDGAGSYTSFDGTSQTSLYKINNESFRVIRVIKKRIMFNVPQVTSGIVGSVDQDPSQDHHDVSLDIPLPKKLVYATQTSSYPDNFAPFMVLGFIDNTWNGDNAPGITESVQVQGRSELWYKDA